MLTLDTSAILAALDRHDPRHADALHALREDGGPFVVPEKILAEICYMLDARLGSQMVTTFLGDLEDGAFTRDFGEMDLPRIRALIERYQGLPLGFADAAVVACAERHGGRILTFDRRDFGSVARDERAITLLPGD